MLRFGVAGLLRADDSTRSGMIMRDRVALSGFEGGLRGEVA